MEKPVNLFWTGGWDSSFRLLELLLVQKRPVQPYYLLDPNRKSTPYEIIAMEKIKNVLLTKHPEVKSLLLSTISKKVEDLRPNDHITGQYKRLLALKHLGGQYDWMARFAHEEGINDLELCVYTPSPSFFHTYVRPCLVEVHDGNEVTYRIKEEPTHPDLSLFRYYKFPNHGLSKRETQELAKQYEFLNIMEYTWFCHKPNNQNPCGLCVPCRITMAQGLGRRIPFNSKMLYYVHFKVKPSMKKFLGIENVSLTTIPWFSKYQLKK